MMISCATASERSPRLIHVPGETVPFVGPAGPDGTPPCPAQPDLRTGRRPVRPSRTYERDTLSGFVDESRKLNRLFTQNSRVPPRGGGHTASLIHVLPGDLGHADVTPARVLALG